MTTPEPQPSEPSTLQPFKPPYIPSSGDPIYSNEPQALPRSTIDGIHGTRGDEPVRWTPEHPGDLPPYGIGSRYTQDEHDPSLWWPAPPSGPNQIRPDRPGTAPAAYRRGDEEKPDRGAQGAGKLDVNPADLHNAADEYAQLQAAAAAIGPQAVDEVNRIIATHGAMGYPVAVGVVAGLARRQAQLDRKAADFGRYAERFTEHAAEYQAGDREGAGMYQAMGGDPYWDWLHDFRDGSEVEEPVQPGGAGPGPGAGPAIPSHLI